MQRLYEKLKKYTLEDAINIEKIDRQFLSLEKLYKNKILDDKIYLFIIIVNALICYQLSWKWEDYWEEFWEALINNKITNFSEIYIFFEEFIPESKNNKRFVNIKLKRVQKIETFYLDFISKSKYYYEYMWELVDILSKIMNQKKEAKTIVFAVKMFSYWARNIFDLKYFPEDIMIPIDSRLEKLYEKYNLEWTKYSHIQEIKSFYIELSKKLKIPLLHLDAILWVNYDELVE